MGRTTFTRQELERRLDSAFVGFSVANAVGAALTLLGSAGSGPDEKFLTIAGGATVCIATIFTFWTSAKLSRLMKLDVLKNEHQIALAHRDVAEAQRLTAEAVKQTAEANERIARMQRVRTLTVGQHEAIRDFFIAEKDAGPTPVFAWFDFLSVSDSEAQNFAVSLRDAIHSAGVIAPLAYGRPHEFLQSPEFTCELGVKHGEDEYIAGVVRRMVTLFEAIGLPLEVFPSENQSNKITLVVFRKSSV